MLSKEETTTERRSLPNTEKEAQLVQLLIKSGLFLQRELNQVCQGYGLNINQFSVINEIVLQGPVSQKMLCERLLSEKSNISKIVKTLLDKNIFMYKAKHVWEQCPGTSKRKHKFVKNSD